MALTPSKKASAALIERHPLQRLESPSRGLSAALHLLGLTSFASSFKYLVDNPNDVNFSYGWHFQYLTIIGLGLATSTYAVGWLADLLASRRLFQLKNALSVCSAPLEVVISILYWSLHTINPKLVLPEFMPPTSLAVDLGFHAAPAAFLTLDLLFFSPPWTVGFLPAGALSAAISTAYYVWVEACHTRNGWYPYPIFEAGLAQRIALFTGSAAVMATVTWLLQRVYTIVNGRPDWGASAGERPGDVKGEASSSLSSSSTSSSTRRGQPQRRGKAQK